eukprot:6607314-Pyramimonas_sp.AAC.1
MTRARYVPRVGARALARRGRRRQERNVWNMFCKCGCRKKRKRKNDRDARRGEGARRSPWGA